MIKLQSISIKDYQGFSLLVKILAFYAYSSLVFFCPNEKIIQLTKELYQLMKEFTLIWLISEFPR